MGLRHSASFPTLVLEIRARFGEAVIMRKKLRKMHDSCWRGVGSWDLGLLKVPEESWDIGCELAWGPGCQQVSG